MLKLLQKELVNNTIKLELFISVTEDITDVLELYPELDNGELSNNVGIVD